MTWRVADVDEAWGIVYELVAGRRPADVFLRRHHAALPGFIREHPGVFEARVLDGLAELAVLRIDRPGPVRTGLDAFAAEFHARSVLAETVAAAGEAAVVAWVERAMELVPRGPAPSAGRWWTLVAAAPRDLRGEVFRNAKVGDLAAEQAPYAAHRAAIEAAGLTPASLGEALEARLLGDVDPRVWVRVTPPPVDPSWTWGDPDPVPAFRMGRADVGWFEAPAPALQDLRRFGALPHHRGAPIEPAQLGRIAGLLPVEAGPRPRGALRLEVVKGSLVGTTFDLTRPGQLMGRPAGDVEDPTLCALCLPTDRTVSRRQALFHGDRKIDFLKPARVDGRRVEGLERLALGSEIEFVERLVLLVVG